MKLVNYRCDDCGFEEDKLYESFEDVKSMLRHYCPQCGGILRKWNFKNNSQQWKFNDLRK